MKLVLLFVVVDLAAPGDVSLADLERFPSWHCAEAQRELCREWRAWWKNDAFYQPRREQHERIISELCWLEDYWDLLFQCQQDWIIGEEWQLQLLEQLRDMVGLSFYRQGWHPKLLPAVPLFPLLEKGEVAAGGAQR